MISRSLTRGLLCTALAAAGFAATAQADVIANWTFETSIPTTAGPHAAELGVNAASSQATAFHAGGAAVYSNPVGNGSAESFSANGWTTVGDYYQFTTSTVGYSNITIGWAQTRSGTGPATFDLQVSVNGGAFTTLDDYTVTQATWSGTTSNAGTIFAAVPAPGAANAASVTFRLVSQATAASTGTNRVDDIIISGDIAAASGACCTGTSCTITTQALCGGTFNGAASCSPDPCNPTGACCTGTTCQIVTLSACNGLSGTFNGAASCTPNPCDPSGACCFGTTCDIATSATECATFGGTNFQQGVACSPNPCAASTDQIVISQIYGGGGNAGATFNADFVELFNRGTTTVTMTNWSIQYGSATGTTWAVSPIASLSLQSGQYALVQLGTNNATIGAALPTPDVVGTATNIGSNAGKIVLVNNTTPIGASNPTVGPNIVDFIGYGSTANASRGAPTTAILSSAAGNTQSFLRKGNGCVDTSNNAADFVANGVTPTPRNSASPFNNCATATMGACCTSGSDVCNLTTAGGCAGTFNGLGSTCTPNPCIVPTGSCCTGTTCTQVEQSLCSGTWAFGGVCTPNPCAGACCTGTSCTITAPADCLAPAFFRSGLTCAPGDCPTAVAFQAGDIAYGANVASNVDSLWQIRNGVRVGTLTGLNFAQSVEFDNAASILHNPSGNLLSLNFGTTTTGAILQNFATNGTQGAQIIANFSGAGSPALPLTRATGLTVAPNNARVLVYGNDVRQFFVLDYTAGATVGTGAGASITAFNSTIAPPTTPGATDFVPVSSNGQGTGWLDNTNGFAWVVNGNAAYNPGSGIPVAANTPVLFTFTVDATTGAIGAPIARYVPSVDVDTSSRFLSAAYNPQVSPYVYLLSSSFAAGTNTSKTQLYVVDPATWTEVQTVLLPTAPLDPAPFSGINTGREIALGVSGSSKKLFISAFAGASGNPVVIDSTPIVFSVDISASNQLTAATLTGVVSRGAASSASFNGLDVALPPVISSNVSCCRGTTCNLIPSGTCTGQVAGSNSITVTSCGAGNSLATCCYGDFNHDGNVTIDDLFLYLNAYFTGSPWANVGGDGVVSPTIDDLFLYINAYFTGCQP